MTTEQRIQHFFATEPMHREDAPPLGREEPLLGSGILDSLGILRLVTVIEEAFGVTVPAPEMTPEHFQTVRRITALVSRLQQSRASPSPPDAG